MKKLMIVGDIHGNFDLLNKYAKNTACDVILSCGDNGILNKDDYSLIKAKYTIGNFWEYLSGKKRFEVPIYAIKGNHENFDIVDNILSGKVKIKNFHMLKNGEVFDLEGLKIGVLGGNYSPKHYEDIVLKGHQRKHFLKSEVDNLKKQKCDILLMHDVIDNTGLHSVNFSDLTYQLIDAVKPKMVFLGHFHIWGHIPLLGTHIILLPKIQDGYFLLDTVTNKGTGVRFDNYNIK